MTAKRECDEFYLSSRKPGIAEMPPTKFITVHDAFEWAADEAAQKAEADLGAVGFPTLDEKTRVRYMHIGSDDDEPATVTSMDACISEQGSMLDTGRKRHRHGAGAIDAPGRVSDKAQDGRPPSDSKGFR